MENKLERKYGLFTAICMVVGIVIGSGVFFKAQTILQKTEGNMPLGILAWIIGGMIMVFCILAFGVVLQQLIDFVLEGIDIARTQRIQLVDEFFSRDGYRLEALQ